MAYTLQYDVWKLPIKFQDPTVYSCWEKCDGNLCNRRTDGRKDGRTPLSLYTAHFSSGGYNNLHVIEWIKTEDSAYLTKFQKTKYQLKQDFGILRCRIRQVSVYFQFSFVFCVYSPEQVTCRLSFIVCFSYLLSLTKQVEGWIEQ